MKHKTAELEGALLDAAVALSEGKPFSHFEDGQAWLFLTELRTASVRECPRYSREWSDGGPIIERNDWCLPMVYHQAQAYRLGRYVAETLGGFTYFGPTPLVAAMRAFVASKLGEEVELP